MANVQPYSRLTDFDIALFLNGKHTRLYEKLGAFEIEHEGTVGTFFAVWAPNAKNVFVTGNFNFWDSYSHPLFPRWDSSASWGWWVVSF